MNGHTINSEKTKHRLAAALREMLVEKSFDKISISDLARACDINRKTFYYHFKSTDDLLDWMIRQETILAISKIDFLEDYDRAIDFVIEYIEKNRAMLRTINRSVGRGAVHEFLKCNIMPSVAGILKEARDSETDKSTATGEVAQFNESFRETAFDKGFEEFTVEFYTEAIVGILQSWIEKDTPRDRDTITRYATRILKNARLIG